MDKTVTTEIIDNDSDQRISPLKESKFKSFFIKLFTVALVAGVCVNAYLLSELLHQTNRMEKKLQSEIQYTHNTQSNLLRLSNDVKQVVATRDQYLNLLDEKLNQLFLKTDTQLNQFNLKLKENVIAIETKLIHVDTTLNSTINENSDRLNAQGEKLQELISNTEENVLFVKERIESIEQPIKELEFLLEEEFNDSVSSASSEFVRNINKERMLAKNKIGKYFETFPEKLENEVKDLDGYISRGENDFQQTNNVLISFIKKEMNQNIKPIISQFQDAYIGELSTLKNRLLIDELQQLDIKTGYANKDLFQFYRTNQLSNKLNDGGVLKTVEEAATWIPFVGDGWDLMRSFVYDPRFKYEFEDKIQQSSNRIQEDVQNVISQMVDKFYSGEIEELCKQNFDKKYALKSYFRRIYG